MGDKGKRLKNPEAVAGKKIALSSSANEKPFNIQHPVFCFRYLSKKYHTDHCEPNEKAGLISTLVELSQLTWDEIRIAHRHGKGAEKIEVSSIKTALPNSLTEDVTSLLAFRFYGKAPMVGHRNRFVFHIIYLDRDFTLYNH